MGRPRRARAVDGAADPGRHPLSHVSVCRRGGGADAGRSSRGGPLRPRDKSARGLGRGDDPVRHRARLLRRRVRARHDGVDLRDRHRPPGRDDVLPGFWLPRRQRLHPAAGDLQRPPVPRDGVERQGRPADGARTRVRHDGHHDDEDPRHAERATHRDHAPGARGPVFCPARDHHGHPGRHLLRRVAHALRRGLVAGGARRVPGGACAPGRPLGVHHGIATDPAPAAEEPADQDGAAGALVSR